MKDADFRDRARAYLAEQPQEPDDLEPLALLLATVYRAGVKDERKRQAKNRERTVKSKRLALTKERPLYSAPDLSRFMPRK